MGSWSVLLPFSYSFCHLSSTLLLLFFIKEFIKNFFIKEFIKNFFIKEFIKIFFIKEFIKIARFFYSIKNFFPTAFGAKSVAEIISLDNNFP